MFYFSCCFGTANIVINGGTPPYEINQGNINNLNQIYAGTYTISVTDINGCEVEEQIEINQPPLLNIDLSITNALCPNDNSGQASVNIFGGSPPYSQSWTDNFGNIVNPNTLLPGQYQLTVTDQFNCQTTETFNVLSPEPDPEFAHLWWNLLFKWFWGFCIWGNWYRYFGHIMALKYTV